MLVTRITCSYSNVVVNLHVGLDVSASVWGFFFLQGALSPTPNLTTVHIIPGVQGWKHQPFQKESSEAGQGGIIVIGGYINGKHNVNYRLKDRRNIQRLSQR